MDELNKLLAKREHELELFVAIDNIRDAANDTHPEIMFERLAKLLVDVFEAEGGAIIVVNETYNAIESQVAIGIKPDMAAKVCNAVLENIEDTDRPYIFSTADLPHAIGMRIVLNDLPLGSMALVRTDKSHPFSKDDLSLLEAAESQIDSAIVQAHRMWKLIQRNRELDAIYQLDRLRDDNSDEGDLINGFVNVLIEQFSASLCMVILSHVDSGELITRGVVDKVGFQPDEFDMISKAVQQADITQSIDSPRAGYHLLASPFIIAGMRLGGIVVGRKTAYDVGDHRLLYAMSSQMDSAIVYSRVIQQLAQRNQELEIIYHIDQIRDSDIDFDAMLQAVLGELCQAVTSEMGYILLYSQQQEDQLEIKSSTQEGVVTSAAYYEAIHAISRRALDTGDMVYENSRHGEVRSIIAVPLVLHDKIIGVFGGVNSRNARGFNAEDRRMLNAIVSQVDTAVFERLEQRRVRRVLGRSVDPKVLEHLLKHADAANVLAGERMNVSVLFADLRGSTEWAERTEPDKLAQTLNKYLGTMTDVIFEYGGTLDKFVGDEVIGLFGAPLTMRDHAERCAAAALRMQEVMAELIQEMKEQGLELPPMGVGVSTGDAICGEFGTAQRTDYTAMGRMMNLGARLCSAAKGGEVVISEKTYNEIQDIATVEQLDDVSLKGIGKATAFKLKKLNTKL